MRWRWGTFSLLHLISPLAANRTVRWADDDGQIALVDSAAQTYSAAVPFRKATTAFQTQAVSGAITFTIASGNKTPGATTYYRLTGNGLDIPNVSAFKQINTDTAFDARSGMLNVLKFTYDGTDHWVEIWQEKGALPSFNTIALTFPTRAGNTITNAGQVYTPASSAGNFDSYMSSAQAIPQDKAGRITVKVQDTTMVALCDTGIAEAWTTNNFEYFVWRATANAFSGRLGTTVIDSGVAMPSPCWLRLTRNSTGVVTAECSSNGTSWTLYRTYSDTTLAPLWVTANLSGLGQKTFEVISFEVEP